ncbi:FAD-binding protein [Actinosynnema sp. NPDC050801]|uniref:FAD-binding protein n=1 Tax=unclassified Actinosynnema TaxID=2637065 RepID=UPI0033F655C1
MTDLTNGAPTRRTILKQITVGAAVVGWSAASGSWAPAGADTAGVAALPRLDGTITIAPEVLAKFGKDWGNLKSGAPKAVLRPGSVRDIVAMVRYARANKLKIAMNGHGGSGPAADHESHSNYGQALVPGGIAIDSKGLSTIHSIGTTSAWVDAGVTWAQLVDATLARGRTPAAHTGYQHLSVGGTASIGGIGGMVQKQGLQIDTITEIEIVTGEGYVVRASATERPDLFNAALGGGGQVGIITKARVKLVPAPARVAVFTLVYQDLATFVADSEMLMRDGRFDAQDSGPRLKADGTGWYYRIDGVAFYNPGSPPDRAALLAGLHDDQASREFGDLPFRDWSFRLDAFEVSAKEGGFWYQPHPWLSLLIPGSKIVEFARTVLGQTTAADMGIGFSLMYPFSSAKLTRPLYKLPNEPVVYLFDLLRMPFPNDPNVPSMMAQNRRIYDLAVSLGGKRYIMGAIPGMTVEDWRRHFGSDWDRLVAAKRRYDPDNVLTPGQGFFG